MKICSKCKLDKQISEFHHNKSRKDGFDNYCKECAKIKKQKYNIDYKEQIAEYNKMRQIRDAEKITVRQKRYYQHHKEEKKRKFQQYYQIKKTEIIKAIDARRKQRKKVDLNFKFRRNISVSIRNVLHGQQKSAPTLKLLGVIRIKDFRSYLEKQFKPGMSWENYGKVWHIDHIKPCASFDLSKPEEQKICFHFSNQQPLWATTEIARQFGDMESIGNINKGDKYE
jgi:hypothetical protein